MLDLWLISFVLFGNPTTCHVGAENDTLNTKKELSCSCALSTTETAGNIKSFVGEIYNLRIDVYLWVCVCVSVWTSVNVWWFLCLTILQQQRKELPTKQSSKPRYQIVCPSIYRPSFHPYARQSVQAFVVVPTLVLLLTLLLAMAMAMVVVVVCMHVSKFLRMYKYIHVCVNVCAFFSQCSHLNLYSSLACCCCWLIPFNGLQGTFAR